MTKARQNPTGHPLSGPPDKGRVTYRPRVGNSRPRLQVPEDVASKLEDDAVNATDRRRQVAGEAARAEKERRTAKKSASTSTRKRKRSTSSKPRKRSTSSKPSKAPKPRKKAPPRAVKQVAKALDVPQSTAQAIVSCAKEKVAKKRSGRKKAADSPQIDLFAKNPPALKRGPVTLADLQVCTFLGFVRELAYDTPDGYRQRLKRPSKAIPLYWAPAAKAAFFVNGKTRRSKATKGVRDGAARRVYQTWTGREPNDAYTITIPNGRNAKWRKLGRGFTITYRSERTGEPPDGAEHDLGRTVGVYTFGTLWVITGSGLRVTKHGLEG